MQAVARAVTVRVPAKINVQLGVGQRREDGYHDLATVFHAVSLFDEVTATDGLPGSGIRIHVEGRDAQHVPLGEQNLAYKAADALATYADVVPDVQLSIKKSIPVAGGLAGGSADAAGALLACDALWRTGLGREELDTLAGRLGADVTFSLHGGTAIGTGKGEQLTPALISGHYHWVLGISDEGLSTPEVYQRCDRLRESKIIRDPEVSEDLMSALRRGDAEGVGAALTNDLQPAAIAMRPQLEIVLEAGLSHGALGAVVSGSGPTCAFLARDPEQALDIAAGLMSSGLVSDALTAEGPVHGARIVE